MSTGTSRRLNFHLAPGEKVMMSAQPLRPDDDADTKTVASSQPDTQRPLSHFSDPTTKDGENVGDEDDQSQADGSATSQRGELGVIEQLAKSLAALGKPSSDTIKGPEARAPDKFDGTKPNTLRSFLSQLHIVFLNHPGRFRTDRSKVLFAGSYLTGIAANWFEPFVEEGSAESLLLDNWLLFKDRLIKVFGDPNAEATAEHNLDSLFMKDNQHISQYITKFRTEQVHVRWDDSALRHRFRLGLCDRILDALADRPAQPRTLSELMEVALQIDNQYWEREREKKMRARTLKGADLSSQSTSDTASKSKKKGKGGKKENQTASNTKSEKKAEYLGKDGKVTDAEKKRRQENGLCNYCGGPHKLDDCASRPRKGKAAATSASTDSSASNNPKN